ncbi:MAG: CPBP family intramembrane glutamic endopeptidase [Marinilabilia sp.]
MKSSFAHFGGFGKLLLLVLMVFVSFMIFSLLALLAALPFMDFSLTSSPTEGLPLDVLKYFQIVQSFSVFIIPSLLAGLIFWGHMTRGIGFFQPRGSMVMLSFLVIIAAQPLVSYLGIWNSQMQLPEALRGVEQWMEHSENNARDIIYRFLDTPQTSLVILNVLMIVILPALGEEMLFRGVLQPVFHEWLRSKHLAVWITAFLFSAIHLQFFTFLPRFFLGLALGYLMLWGRNIWYPVAGHFANNLLSLIVFYSYRHTSPDINPLEPGAEELSPFWLVPGLVLTIALFGHFFRQGNKLIKQHTDVRQNN